MPPRGSKSNIMCVRIDDAGQYRSAFGINDCDILRNLEVCRPANGNNAIPPNSNKTIGDGIASRAVDYDPIGYD